MASDKKKNFFKAAEQFFDRESVYTALEALPLVGGIFTAIKQRKGSKASITYAEVQSEVMKALAEAQKMGENQLATVTSALNRLDFVRQSPQLEKAISSRRKQLERQKGALESDIKQLDIASAQFESDAGKAIDDPDTYADKVNRLKEAANNAKQNIKDIAAQVESRV